MKKMKYVILSTLLITWTQACHNPDQKWDSKSSADTLNNMKDSVADSSKGSSRDLVMKVNKDDAKFAVEAANSGLAEVALGNLAQQKAVDPQVKDFGAMMVSDHSKANDRIKTLAKTKGISLPATLSNDEQKLKDELSSKSGADFDRAYAKAMIKDHKEDIESFQNAVKSLKDTDLKKFAVNTLPVLQKHLDAIEKIGKMVNK